jgi:hypothetical protein
MAHNRTCGLKWLTPGEHQRRGFGCLVGHMSEGSRAFLNFVMHPNTDLEPIVTECRAISNIPKLDSIFNSYLHNCPGQNGIRT